MSELTRYIIATLANAINTQSNTIPASLSAAFSFPLSPNAQTIFIPVIINIVTEITIVILIRNLENLTTTLSLAHIHAFGHQIFAAKDC
jgi:hypothetical protein